MTLIFQQAFGSDKVDLYKDVLRVPKDCSPSQLRKAYYKQAREFHPDKNDSEDAKLKFQAISFAYSVCRQNIYHDRFLVFLFLKYSTRSIAFLLVPSICLASTAVIRVKF
mmetsp:Transcript_25591/g.70413  ORF Transcript_25591/g.70413 Transcript_25591/m.70413 type:complete len:110 (-) Transcript_25591:320-649(-)